MKKIRKAYVAASGLVLMVVGTELGADSKWYKYAVGALTVVAVWAVPNAKDDIQGP